jgi:hypothetical protein
MKRSFRLAVLLLAAVFGCSEQPAQPELQQGPRPSPLVLQPNGLTCTDPGATLSSGAPYQVCFNPANWNRDIIVFIPGYHDPASPPSLPGNLSETPVSLLFAALGYGYASTGFRGTGLVQPATWLGGDLRELVNTAKTLFSNATGRTARYVYQIGGSQGGLGTVLAVERYPNVFSGGLAACGPIGDYGKQIAYVGDFRTVFDYFFAPVISGWPVWTQNLPADPGYIDPSSWDAAEDESAAALADPTNAARIAQVLSVTHAPIDPNVPSTIAATTQDILWYSFRGTNDAIAKLGGGPFGNGTRVYSGSADDAALNAGVARFQFTADPTKLAELQTSGRLVRPLVTIHTTGDPIVPIWHEPLYRNKLSFFGKLLETRITIDRYGHCNFTDAEVLAAFAVLVLKVSGANLLVSNSVLRDDKARATFLRLARQHGAEPVLAQEVPHAAVAP